VNRSTGELLQLPTIAILSLMSILEKKKHTHNISTGSADQRNCQSYQPMCPSLISIPRFRPTKIAATSENFDKQEMAIGGS
jgi:hypothetical protein